MAIQIRFPDIIGNSAFPTQIFFSLNSVNLQNTPMTLRIPQFLTKRDGADVRANKGYYTLLNASHYAKY